MADFTALKNSIRNYIKQNGNAEITGEVLQNILISMVVSMGDGAINGIADGLANEGNARTNADGLLQNAINSISAALGDGYTYAGIATPATTPASGRVFYLALQAGTYTNFGGIVVTQGINILKNNNGTWQLDNVIGIDDVPTDGSEKLVTSGGVFANIGAFDISDYNKSGSTLATYANLTAALAALPSEYQKGGMSVKFVQSSDNKYVQYRLVSDSFNTTPSNWQKSGAEVSVSQNTLMFGNSETAIHTDSMIALSPASVIDNSAINADGSISTDSAFLSKVVVFSLPDTESVISLVIPLPDFTSPYISGALYDENGNPIKLLETIWIANFTYRFLVYNNFGAKTLKVCVKDTKVDDLVATINAEVIRGAFTNDSYGVYTLLNRNSYLANSAINANGTITTDSQWLTSGVVSSYTISEDRIYKLHFKVPAFSDSFRAMVLRKNGTPILTFAPLNGTASDVDFVLDTKGVDADELLICELSLTSGNAIVSESAPLLYAQSPTKNIDAIYNAMNGADVYTISQESGKFGLIPRIYIEGLAKSDDGAIISLDNGSSIIPEHPDYVNTPDTVHSFGFDVKADGYQSKRDTITIHKHSASNVKNKGIKIMCIGDSLTDAGYAGVVEFIFKALNQDYGNNDINALMVGTMSDAANLTLGNYSFAVRGFNEGRSGWAISDYLRHFNIVTENKTQWDMLGLGTMTRNSVPTRTYEAYIGSDAQKELMRTTCHGWYDADPSEELWTWLKTGIYSSVFSGSFEYDGVTYDLGSSYSSSSDAAIVAAVKLICSSSTLWKPCPFYDYDTVQSSNGQYAFNLETYLNRYKTIDSDGTTRLVVGSTAGTWVDNVNDFDVCTPTHVVIIMNENDARWISSGTPVADDLKLCADLVAASDNTIKISIGSTRGYGAFRPSSYNSDGYVGNFYVSNRRLQTWTALRSVLQNTNYDLLPLYAMQSVVGVGGGRAFDTLDQKSKFNMVGDRLHTGESALSYLDRAYLVSAWVISTYVE